MMFLNLVSPNYLNSPTLKVKHNLEYANFRCIHQLLLKNLLHSYCTVRATTFNSSNKIYFIKSRSSFCKHSGQSVIYVWLN